VKTKEEEKMIRKYTFTGLTLVLLIAISVYAQTPGAFRDLVGGRAASGAAHFVNFGGQTSSPPNWAQGTFYSYDPRLALTIESNGRVTAESSGGAISNGRYYQDRIYLDNEVYEVSREGNGFRVYNSRSRQTIRFSRNPNGGGGAGGGSGGGIGNNLDDLIGERASSGESELRNRGYRQVDSAKNRMSYTWWYQDRNQRCIMVVTSDGRYADIIRTDNRNCP
jgi:hypothetical protein